MITFYNEDYLTLLSQNVMYSLPVFNKINRLLYKIQQNVGSFDLPTQ